MMGLGIRFSAKLACCALLAAGCLAGAPAVRAAEASSAASASQAPSQSSAACPAPATLEALLAQASDALGGQRFQQAVALLQPLAALNCDPRISLLLAAAFDAQGDPSKTMAELQRAHRVWPSNNSIAASLARSCLAAGDTPKAAQALAHFHATAKTPEQEMHLAVVVFLAAHQLQSAQRVARIAYDADPSAETLILLANTLQMQGRYPDVNRLLGSRRAAYAGSAAFFVTLAESESDASLNQAARSDLERAIALDPGLYQSHYLMGNVLAKLNDPEGAAAEYHKAIDLAPNQPRTWFQLALLLRTKQDQAGEEQALTQALAVDPHYGPAQCEMGRILLEGHHPAQAVDHLTAAVQDNPRFEKAYFLLARAYAQLGEQDKSQEAVRRLVAVRKENQPAMGRQMKDLPEASRTTQP